MDKYRDLDESLNKYLRLATFPVAVKLIKDTKNLDNVKFLKKPDEKLAICQIFSYARYYGWTMVCTKQENLCPLADISLGFEESNQLFEEGGFFVGRYNETKEAAKKTASTMPKIPFGNYQAVLSGALGRIDFEPDLIMVWGNSAQTMRIIQGYLWKRGGRVSMSTFCDGVCADTISNAVLTGDLQIAFPCLGDRRFGMATDNDLIASIPIGIINEIIEGLEKTHKAGTRYPIPYQITTPKFFLKLKKQLDKIKRN
ncbi:MAG: DUF169 domain-containing protein [Promethearchaeota archaeon]